MKYKQVITIDEHIDGIFKLPCVESCHKCFRNFKETHYFVVKCVNLDYADIGDKLCEDYEGDWFVEKAQQ